MTRDPALPLQLWELHRRTAVDTAIEPMALRGSDWSIESLQLTFEGAGFLDVTADPVGALIEVVARRALTLADTVGADMSLLCVGLNPSVRAAEAGVGFVTPGNRFWPAALAAGLVSVDRDPLHALEHHGVGMTDVVKRATPRATEITAAEYRHGIIRLDALCSWLQPRVVCFVGLSGWRAAVDRRAAVGWQPRGIGGRPAFVMHNPSGLNAHVRVGDLARQLAEALAGPPGS